jgi:glycosyltransferase involved in cell wall biosynthesis
MTHGLATIVNAHGSMAELPLEAVWMLPDAFTDAALVEALTVLHGDAERCHVLGDRARQTVREQHAPVACAAQYAAAIETFHTANSNQLSALTHAVAELANPPSDRQPWVDLSRCVAQSLPLPNSMRQILVDVSALCRDDLKTGIQRVARSVLLELIQTPPAGYVVEPVYASSDGDCWKFRYARQYAARLLGFPDTVLEDAVVEFSPSDILLCPDLTGRYLIEVERLGLLQRIRNTGTRLYYVIFDLLPVLRPEFFPPPTEREFERWLQAVARVADGVIGISEAVSGDFAAWLRRQGPQRLRPLDVGWFHLGADISASAPTSGHDAIAEQALDQLRAKPSFLMVGTIEPRKGHLQVIAAFEALWAQGVDANLVIVGKEGWKGLPESHRRTIPEIVAKLRQHPELGKRLFWLEGIGDDYLEKVYAASTCLIAASEDEGFGLPLIEAAQHKLPIVARDIPVFREVAGAHAFYFSGQDAASLADALQAWLQLHACKCAPCSDTMPWLTWKQSAQGLLRIILENDWTMRVMTDSHLHPGTLQNHFSQRLTWRNFHAPEQDIRWTDGNAASIGFVWPDGSAPQAELRLLLDALGAQRLTLRHNGVEVFRGHVKGQHHELRCRLGAVIPGFNILEFTLPDARQPGNGDSRRLALALRQFQIDFEESRHDTQVENTRTRTGLEGQWAQAS